MRTHTDPGFHQIRRTARVILAFSHENTRERILSRRTEREPDSDVQFDPNDLRKTMAKIRSQFYEFDENPHGSGFSGLVVPIFNYLDRIEAALTVIMPMRANDPNQETRYLRTVKESAIEISRVLGSV